MSDRIIQSDRLKSVIYHNALEKVASDLNMTLQHDDSDYVLGKRSSANSTANDRLRNFERWSTIYR